VAKTVALNEVSKEVTGDRYKVYGGRLKAQGLRPVEHGRFNLSSDL
jgi:hypothetical protein